MTLLVSLHAESRRDSQICDSSSSPLLMHGSSHWESTHQFFLSDLCSVCHAWTLPMVLLRGWGYEASQKENDGESGCDDVGLGRALSRKAGSVSAKAETSECKEHPWCDITVAPCAAHALLLSRLRTSERVWQCRCRNHSCGGGGRRGGRPTPEIRF